GPPRLAPPCLSANVPTLRSGGEGTLLVARAGILPTSDSVGPKRYPVPLNAFAPLRVMAFTAPPENPPCRTSYGDTTTYISWMASRLIGCVPVVPPGVPLEARPKRSLFTAPSIDMLL